MRIKVVLILMCVTVLMVYGWYKMLVDKTDKRSVIEDSIEKGNEYVERGYFFEAAECYKQAYSEQENSELEENISYCYYMLGDEDNSYIWAQKAYENGYMTEYIYLIRFQKCMKQGEKNEAYEILLDARENGIDSDILEEQYMELKSEYIDMYYSFSDVSEFCCEAAIVWEEDTSYIVDNEGRKTMPDNDLYIYDITDDECIKDKWSDTPKLYAGYYDGLCRYFDTNGYVRVSPDEAYGYIGAPKDGMILVNEGELWGYIDTDFNKIDISYEDATGFACGRAAVKKAGSWVIVDDNLTPVNDDTYDEVLVDDFKTCSAAGAIIVKKAGHYCILSLDGDVLLDGIKEAKCFPGKESYAAVKTGGSWKLADSAGQIIYEGEEEELDSASCGLVGYRDGELWGYKYIDGSGVIQPCFQQVKAFNRAGCAFVMENDSWSMIKLEVFAGTGNKSK